MFLLKILGWMFLGFFGLFAGYYILGYIYYRFMSAISFNRLLKVPIGVYTFFGVPGSGKTTFAAAISYLANKKNIPVYSNVPIKGTYMVKRDEIGQYNLPIFDSEYCVLLVDECGIEYNNRNFKSNFKDDSLAWWKLHRHYKTLVFIFSQSYEDMDKKLRDLTQQFFLVQRCGIFKKFRKALPIRFKIGINELSGDIQDMYYFDNPLMSLFTNRYIYCKRFWNLFDSWDCPKLPDLPTLNKYDRVNVDPDPLINDDSDTDLAENYINKLSLKNVV